MRKEQEEEQRLSSSSIYYVCYMIIHLLKPFPNSLLLSGLSSSSRQRSPLGLTQVSPAAFASLFLGVSLALMLFGSITFVIGFILMPWIVAFVFLFYLAGFFSKLSDLAQSFFCSGDVPSCNFREAKQTPSLLWKCQSTDQIDAKKLCFNQLQKPRIS
ncbi:hypothetical protein CUMW_183600 [Citrus unshiu]|uniref:Uncharacterized protein n=1 Tax=Citrus unshiu TaxID=55188 RepID=A0A2H5Q018_CITUN|nr:hypothetical protein CUMW_183600 [Citrus unshiu]